MTGPPERPRVFVDFQNTDPKGRVRLTTVGTLRDLDQLGLVLREGLEVLLYCLELEAEGAVTFSTEENLWVAELDWDKVQNRTSAP